MLVLSRDVNECIIIGDDILVTVVACGHGWVRLGIDAPNHVSVDRLEIREKKRRDGLYHLPDRSRLWTP